MLTEFGRIANYKLPADKQIDFDLGFKYGLSKLHKMCSDKRGVALARGKAELRYPDMECCFLNVVQNKTPEERAKGAYSRFFWEPNELPENNSLLAAAIKVSLTVISLESAMKQFTNL